MRKCLALVDAIKTNSWHGFLLARFKVDYIVKFPTAREIKQALGDLSILETMGIDASNPERGNEHRMNEVYDRILGAIREQPPKSKSTPSGLCLGSAMPHERSLRGSSW